MGCKPSDRPWTVADDRYLFQNRAKLSNRMMAEYLGRTRNSVETRIRRLKAKGYSLINLPTGDINQANPISEPKKISDVSIAAERDAMRDEVVAYLKAQVEKKYITMMQANQLAQAISRNVLKLPDMRFKRFCRKSIQAIVADFL